MRNMSKEKQITDTEKDYGLVTVNLSVLVFQTDGQIDRRYQTYYLPCFVVDNGSEGRGLYD